MDKTKTLMSCITEQEERKRQRGIQLKKKREQIISYGNVFNLYKKDPDFIDRINTRTIFLDSFTSIGEEQTTG